MKKFLLLLNIFLTKKIIFFCFAIIGYIVALTFIETFINQVYFSYNFTSNDIVISEVLEKENIIRAKNNVVTYDGIYILSDKEIDNYLIDKYLTITYDNNHYTIIVDSKLVNDTETYGRKFVVNLLSNYEIQYLDSNLENSLKPVFTASKKINSYAFSFIGMGIGLLTYLIYISILFSLSKEKKIINIYNNETIYRTPFHKTYFRSALKFHSSVKNLVLISILIALMIISQILIIPSGFGSLIISFEYIFRGIVGAIFGPFAAIFASGIGDVLGYYAAPTNWSYPFFIGYTLSAMLSGLIYGIAFYKTKITFSKVLFARALDTLIVNVILGQIWMGIISGFAKDKIIMNIIYFSLPKNLIYLIPQAIIMYLIFKALSRFFKSSNLIDEVICDNITLY